MILATSNGLEERTIWDDFDIEVSADKDSDNTFQISVPSDAWDGSYAFDKLVYIPDTEYGGIIKDITSNTGTDTVYIKGFTWRGYLSHRIIQPASGQNYYTVSGELNNCIRTVVGSSLGGLFQVSNENTGVSVNFQFDRYTDYNLGLSKMLASVGYRLDIKYIQTMQSGYVYLSAQPADTYTDDEEISQDAMIRFVTEENRMGVNHLICLGKGELAERTVIHLYADKWGNISQTKTIGGLEEIVEVFDDSSAEDDTLLEDGMNAFKEKLNTKTLTASFGSTDLDLDIGDIINGRDYITGQTLQKPIVRKILNRNNGEISLSYKIQGET